MKGSAVSLLATVIALAIVSQGQQPDPKPSLAGTWIFSAQKSSLKVPAPNSMTLKIEQNDPQVKFARTQAYGDQNFAWNLDIVADGQKEVVDKQPGYSTDTRAYWEGKSLVLDLKITADDGTKQTDLVTYSVSDDGKTLQAVEHLVTTGAKGATNSKWIYEKQSQ